MSTIVAFVLAVAMAASSAPSIAGGHEALTVKQIQDALAMSDLTLFETDNDKEVAAAVGQQITLTLPENPSTGYAWSLDLPSGVDLQSSTFVPTGAAMPGVGGERVWRMSLLGTGKWRIRAKLWRDFEGEGSVIRHFGVTLRVPG